MASAEIFPEDTGTILVFGRTDNPSPEIEVSPKTIPPNKMPSQPMEVFSAPRRMRNLFLSETPAPPRTPPLPLSRAEKQGIVPSDSLLMDIYELVVEVLYTLLLFTVMTANYVTGVVLLALQYDWEFLKFVYRVWTAVPWPIIKFVGHFLIYGVLVPSGAALFIFVVTYIAEYGLSEGPIQIYREISNQGMEYHMYFATLRINFLDAMEQVDTSTYPYFYQQLKTVFVRGLEVLADFGLAFYGIYLKKFFLQCEKEGMDGTCAWWFFGDSVFSWGRLKYWFWGEPGTGFCWIDRSCPEMNWHSWNWLVTGMYDYHFGGLWGVNGMIWEAFLKPFRWW
ncbi:hypothetical protein V8F20_001875 [Naviculisporaceae sp. PSN 640]